MEIDKTHRVSTTKRKSSKKVSEPPKKVKKSLTLSTVQKCKPLIPKILPVEIKVLNACETIELGDVDSVGNCWAFVDWLSFVTESINKTMKFENCGITNTLVFHIPEVVIRINVIINKKRLKFQNFYSCFKKRIPTVYGSGQRNVNDSAAFYVMNILHLKEIFDTPKVEPNSKLRSSL